MKTNVGNIDRALRLVVGFGLMVMIMITPGPAKWLGFIGILPFLSGVFGNCPLYSILGVSTCSARPTGAP